ncbi:MAG: hypothetical protein P8171_23860 [Candidatus Thiodiazotropha sp.]
MPDRAGADDIITQAAAVWTIALLSADHAGVVFHGNLDAAQPVVLFNQAGVVFVTLVGFQQAFERYIEPSGLMHWTTLSIALWHRESWGNGHERHDKRLKINETASRCPHPNKRCLVVQASQDLIFSRRHA